MKKKRFSAALGFVLTLAILVGIAIPLVASAESVSIDFLNPLGTIEPLANQPLVERLADLSGKTVRLLYYGAANSPSQLTCIALGNLLADEYPGLTVVNGGANSLGTVMYDAKTDAQYDTWASGADAIILGVMEDNVASWWISYHAKQLEARGVPVVVLTTSWFESAVKCGAQDNGFAAMRTVTIDRSLYADAYGKATTGTPTARATYLNGLVTGAIFDKVNAALTGPLTTDEKSSAPLDPVLLGDPGVETFTVTGSSYEKATQNFTKLSMTLGFGDGLPLTVPTRELVDEMLATTDRAPDEILGKMMPRNGIITVEKVAINAVMAGARAEHFPVILAAMEAYASAREDNKLFYQALMSNEQNTIVMMVSGPIAKELGFGSGRVLASSHQEADAILGRAFKLCLRNIGHLLQENSTAISGLGRFNDHAMFVFGEDMDMLDYIGWETHGELMGFGDDVNTVTLCYASYTRFNAAVGGGVMTGGLPSGAISAIRTAVGTAANAVPSIVIVNDSVSQMMASTNTASYVAGGFATNAQSWTTKAIAQNRLTAATPNANIQQAFWPVVSGEACTSGRVFNGGTAIGLRGFYTQLIADKASDPIAPSAPLNFTITHSISGEAATLAWDAPVRGDVVKYQVSKDDGLTWYDVASTTTSYVFSGLELGAQYYFRVRAVNDIKNTADIAGVANNATNPLAVSFSASGRGAWAGMPAYAVPGTTIVNIKGPSSVTAAPGATATYTVYVENAPDVTAVQLTLKVDGSFFDTKTSAGLGGFSNVGSIDWKDVGGGFYEGEIVLATTSAVSDDFDVFEIEFNLKGLIGTTEVELVDFKMAYEGGWVACGYGNTVVTTDILMWFSPFDLNQDGVIDLRDISVAMMYYMVEFGDPNWDEAQIANVNGDLIIDIADLILIRANFT